MNSSPSVQLPHTTDAIAQLQTLVQRDIQPQWRVFAGDVDHGQQHSPLPEAGLQAVEVQENGSIIWPANRQIRWFQQCITFPQAWSEFPLNNLVLRLALTWWATDAQIYLNGELVQAGDLFDSAARVVLSNSTQPGDCVTVTLRLESPGHDIGGLMRSRLIYEASDGIDPGFVADELGVLRRYVTAFHPEQRELLESAVADLDWSTVQEQDAFLRELQQLRDRLLPLSTVVKQRRFNILGHAHLDMAWLWEAAETYDVAERTFRSVVQLQTEFPQLTFCHTSPVIYEWLETAHPDLFSAIQKAHQAGQWDPVGGMWVEPDVNLIGGEAIARQLLYGQVYTQAAFGKRTRVAWLTDSFGFCWQLPQLLSQAGIDYFVTQKLHWNDSTEFPHGAFWWRSPDGSQVMTLMSPPNVEGVMDTNPNTMANYAIRWETQTGCPEMLWLPGVGDHGGGPSRDMLTVQKRWADSPFFPQSQFSTAAEYLDLVRSRHPESLPTWNDELYLEFHRGCYTSHADQKWFNRRCEISLFQAEMWSAIAQLLGNSEFPQAAIEQAWKLVLFNQFHDILPGTSIPEVFVTATQEWQQALETSEQLKEVALTAIATQVQLSLPPTSTAQPWIIFNSVNIQRWEMVKIVGEFETAIAYDHQGNVIPSQITAEGELLVMVDCPAIGYTLVWIDAAASDQTPEFPAEPVLENDHLRVEISPETGAIARLWDHVNQREVLNGEGNVLQFFQDQGQYWDAWNIDPDYAQHPLSEPQLIGWCWLENGAVRQRLRVELQFQQSHFAQDYILESESPLLRIETTVDWQEEHVLLKTAFPLRVKSDRATYEMACGAITRSTNPQTPAEKAKWEVAAYQWADLGDENYGVSLLNDCKYGYDAQPNQLRLTLLRSPRWPDPSSDIGHHQFTYAIYPHRGSWQAAKTPHWAACVNQPLQAVVSDRHDVSPRPLATEGQFFQLEPHLRLMAFKTSEQEPNHYILRGYEAYGVETKSQVRTSLTIAPAGQTNLLEDAIESSPTLRPWQIVSYRLQTAASDGD